MTEADRLQADGEALLERHARERAARETPAPSERAETPDAREQLGRAASVEEGLAVVVVDGIRTALTQILPPLVARVAAVEEQVRELRPKPRVRHRGEWSAERAYSVNDGVLHHGRLFVSVTNHNRATPAEEGGIAWRPLSAARPPEAS